MNNNYNHQVQIKRYLKKMLINNKRKPKNKMNMNAESQK